MNTCQFQTIANGRKCGMATNGTYCWFHEGVMANIEDDARQQSHTTYADPSTNTVGSSHTFATSNTTPVQANQQHMMRLPQADARPWWKRLSWWKIALIIYCIVSIILNPWFLVLLVIGGLAFMMFRFGGFNYNANDNANENVNQNTVSPHIDIRIDNRRMDD